MGDNQANNEEDLSDIINKFQNILKDKDININEIFDNTESSEEGSNFNLDIETLLKFKTIFEKINDNNNPRNRLLHSLKPFLEDSRKKKLDEYIKIANLLVILNIISDMNSLYLILIIILLAK